MLKGATTAPKSTPPHKDSGTKKARRKHFAKFNKTQSEP